MHKRGVFLTVDIIQEKANRLQFALNSTLPVSEQSNCTFSEGWLYSFQKRHKFKCHKSHGENGSADFAGAEAALPHLKAEAAKFKINDIFNAEETALYYTGSPDSSVGTN